MKKNSIPASCTITLTSPSAVGLWINELCGQISDGMWENARPLDHWIFWCHAAAVVGDHVGVKLGAENYHRRALKNAYNFAALLPHVGKRMLTTGHMAKAMAAAGRDLNNRDMLRAGEYMPETIEEFYACKASCKWKHEWSETYLNKVTAQVAERFYHDPACQYSLKDMRADIKMIKSALKMVPIW